MKMSKDEKTIDAREVLEELNKAEAAKLAEAAQGTEAAQEDEAKQEEPAVNLHEAIKEQAREDEQEHSTTFTLRKILGGDFLTAQMLRRQIGVVLLILIFIFIYISNRYSCQKSLIEIDQLNTELTDAKYKALSSASELTEKCRESNVLNMLQAQNDSTLKIPTQPPYIVEVKGD